MKNQIWVMSPKWLNDILSQVETLGSMFSAGVDVHASMLAAETHATAYSVDDKGTAHVRIAGPIMKSVPWYFSALGIEAASAEGLYRIFDEIESRDDVKRVAIDIDSPGGTLSGLQELSDSILNSSKKTYAYAGDLAASAAYWLGSQADEFTAGRGASIGSIGVYTVVEDISRALSNEGIEVKVISSGGVKGGLVDGLPVTKEVEADLQREIDEAADLFIENIERKRGSFDRELASGKTWLAPTAHKKGLIDGVESRRSFLNRLGASAPSTKTASFEGANVEVNHVSDSKNASEALEAKLAELAGRLEALEDDKAKAQARAEAAEASLEATKAQQKADALAKAQKEGRVAPSMVAAMQKLAGTMEPEEFATHLGAFPVVTRPEVEGVAGTEAALENDYSKDEIAVAKTFGLTVEELRAAGSIAGIKANGDVVRREVN